MNCLFTLNILYEEGFNSHFVSDRVRLSFLNACHRCGCNYAEINVLDPAYCYPNWGKLDGAEHLRGYDKLLYLDGDTIVSDHAPNPFDMCVEDDTIYAVCDNQDWPGSNVPMWMDMGCYNSIAKIEKALPDMVRHTPEKYFNAGFMLFKNSEKIRAMFREVKEHAHTVAHVPSIVYEQTLLNFIAANRVKVEIIPDKWNYLVWGREADPDAYINHYAHAGPQMQ